MKKIINYLDSIEDHRDGSNYSYNLFEKVLTVSSRAKDLQQILTFNETETRNPGYLALDEFNSQKITPTSRERNLNETPGGLDDDEEEEEA